MSSGVQRELTGRASSAMVALIPIAIAINFVGKYLAQTIHLPLFLDTIGTVLAGALGGPWAGGLAGALTNVIYGLAIHPTSTPYAIVNLAIGIFVGLVSRWFSRPGPTLAAGIIITFIAAILSAPITAIVFGGVTGNGSDLLTAFFLKTGRNLWQSVFATEFLVEIVDKVVTCYIVFFILRGLPQRTRVRFGVA